MLEQPLATLDLDCHFIVEVLAISVPEMPVESIEFRC